MTAQSIDQPPRYLVPALGGIYAVLSPYSWPLVRVRAKHILELMRLRPKLCFSLSAI